MRRMINNRGSFCRIDLNSQQVSARHLFVRLFVCLVGFFFTVYGRTALRHAKGNGRSAIFHLLIGRPAAASITRDGPRFLSFTVRYHPFCLFVFVFFRAFLSFTIVIDGIVFSVHHFTKKKRYEDSIQSSEML